MIAFRMRLLLPALALAASLLCARPAAAEDPPRFPATVTLSDGTVYQGEIRSTAGKPLRLYEGDRPLEIPLGSIHHLVTRIENEEEHRIWRWVEDGSREKVYTGETYPKREYETEITLRNGQVVWGHCVAVLYVYVEGKKKPKKVYLKKKEQGEKGKTLADLVYLESIEFEGEAPAGEAWDNGIQLRTTPSGAALAAHAIPREGVRSAQAIEDASGRLDFPDLLPGTYDLAVVTDEKLHLHLAIGKTGGKPADADLLGKLRARVAEISDFFEKREVLAAVREGDRARAVVYKQRLGGTSMGGKLEFRRWELWCMHKGGDRWLVDNRIFLWREHGEDLPPPLKIALTDALGAIVVDREKVVVRFSVPGREE